MPMHHYPGCDDQPPATDAPAAPPPSGETDQKTKKQIETSPNLLTKEE
jgi:hypothetical protein